MKRLVLPILALVLASCGGDNGPSATPTPATQLFPMTLTVGRSAFDRTASGGCAPTRGFADVGPGAEVKLTGDGTLLDVSHLDAGTTPADEVTMPFATKCTYRFTLKAEPGHKFYTVTIGKRDGLSFKWEELTNLSLNIAAD